jgi:hypothetical protein
MENASPMELKQAQKAEVQLEIIFRNRVRVCVIIPFVISFFPRFTLIIHISIS